MRARTALCTGADEALVNAVPVRSKAKQGNNEVARTLAELPKLDAAYGEYTPPPFATAAVAGEQPMSEAERKVRPCKEEARPARATIWQGGGGA